MKKIVFFFCCLFMLLFISNNALSDPYKSNDFPPLEALQKQNWQDRKFAPAEIIGKLKKHEGCYVVYYKDFGGRLGRMDIVMLDTKIWILERGAIGLRNSGVIQK